MIWAYRALMVLDIRIGTRLHIIRVIDTPSRVMNLDFYLLFQQKAYKQKCKQMQINFSNTFHKTVYTSTTWFTIQYKYSCHWLKPNSSGRPTSCQYIVKCNNFFYCWGVNSWSLQLECIHLNNTKIDPKHWLK